MKIPLLHYSWLGLISSLLLLSACRPNLLDDALAGKLPPDQSNTVIVEYCQSCHIHRTFEPLEHTPRMHTLYDRPPYTETTQCRDCHLVRRDTWGLRLRKTVWPAQVAGKAIKTSSATHP